MQRDQPTRASTPDAMDMAPSLPRAPPASPQRPLSPISPPPTLERETTPTPEPDEQDATDGKVLRRRTVYAPQHFVGMPALEKCAASPVVDTTPVPVPRSNARHVSRTPGPRSTPKPLPRTIQAARNPTSSMARAQKTAPKTSRPTATVQNTQFPRGQPGPSAGQKGLEVPEQMYNFISMDEFKAAEKEKQDSETPTAAPAVSIREALANLLDPETTTAPEAASPEAERFTSEASSTSHYVSELSPGPENLVPSPEFSTPEPSSTSQNMPQEASRPESPGSFNSSSDVIPLDVSTPEGLPSADTSTTMSPPQGTSANVASSSDPASSEGQSSIAMKDKTPPRSSPFAQDTSTQTEAVPIAQAQISSATTPFLEPKTVTSSLPPESAVRPRHMSEPTSSQSALLAPAPTSRPERAKTEPSQDSEITPNVPAPTSSVKISSQGATPSPSDHSVQDRTSNNCRKDKTPPVSSMPSTSSKRPKPVKTPPGPSSSVTSVPASSGPRPSGAQRPVLLTPEPPRAAPKRPSRSCKRPAIVDPNSDDEFIAAPDTRPSASGYGPKLKKISQKRTPRPIVTHALFKALPKENPSPEEVNLWKEGEEWMRGLQQDDDGMWTEPASRDFMAKFIDGEERFMNRGGVPIHIHENGIGFLEKLKDFKDVHLFRSKEGLEMTIPEDLSFETLGNYVDIDTMLPVINSSNQTTTHMKLEKLLEAFGEPDEKRRDILNMLSLEFTQIHTHLDEKFIVPKFVREVSIVKKLEETMKARKETETDETEKEFIAAFEKALPRYQKFLLLTMKGAFTDIHVDLSATCVYYHVKKGKKVFYVARPTPENLKIYEEFERDERKDGEWIGEVLFDEWSRVEINEGETAMIPSGYIHFVYTPEDSIVIGGNFMMEQYLETQFRLTALEEFCHHKKFIPLSQMFGDFRNVMWGYMEFCLVPEMRAKPNCLELVEKARIMLQNMNVETKNKGNKDLYLGRKENVLKMLESLMPKGLKRRQEDTSVATSMKKSKRD